MDNHTNHSSLDDRKPSATATPVSIPMMNTSDSDRDRQQQDDEEWETFDTSQLTPVVPIAPPGDFKDDSGAFYDDDHKKAAAKDPPLVSASLNNNGNGNSNGSTMATSSAIPDISRSEKERLKGGGPPPPPQQQYYKDPPPGSSNGDNATNNNAGGGAFLNRADRYRAKMAGEDQKMALRNTGTSTPGAISVVAPQNNNNNNNNAGPIAQVALVPTAQPEEEAMSASARFKQEQDESFYRTWLLVGVLALVVIVGIAIIVGVILATGGGGDDDTSGGSALEPVVMTEAQLQLLATEEFVISVLDDANTNNEQTTTPTIAATIEAISVEGSPQSQAVGWMAKDPQLDQLSDERVTQRFALATFYYATDGPSTWNTNKEMQWLNDTVHECQWMATVPLCGEADMAASLNNPYTHYPVQYLSLNDQNLGGSLPAEISLLTDLIDLSFYQNNLQSRIPSELGLLTNLHTIDLTGNQLTGNIPPQLGQLTELEQLFLEINALTGTVPSALKGAIALRKLRIQGNDGMWGKIPRDVCNLNFLTTDCGSAVCGCGDCSEGCRRG